MHKNPHQNAGNGIKETLIFKNFPREHAPNPPRGSRAKVGQIHVHHPQNYVKLCLDMLALTA